MKVRTKFGCGEISFTEATKRSSHFEFWSGNYTHVSLPYTRIYIRLCEPNFVRKLIPKILTTSVHTHVPNKNIRTYK